MAKLVGLTILTFLTLALVAYSEDCVQVIHLKTGDVEYAGTDARISLELYDVHGYKVSEGNLWNRGLMEKGHDYFERNNLDLFSFKSKCLTSPVCKLVLSQDNSGPHPGWYVSYLQVTSSSSSVPCTQTKFLVEKWLEGPSASRTVTVDLCKSYGDNEISEA